MKGFRGSFCCANCVIWTIVIITLVSLSATTIQSTEKGIEYQPVFARLHKETLGEGLHWLSPGSRVLRWPAVYTTLEVDATCNSFDGIAIDTQVTYQFIPNTAALRYLTLNFGNVSSYEEVVRADSRSSVRHACGDFKAEEFQTNRAGVINAMLQEVQRGLANINSTLIELQLGEITRPARYERAVEQSESARSDIALAENERGQAITKMKTKGAVMRLEVEKILDSANRTVESALMAAELDAARIKDWYSQQLETLLIVKNINKFDNEALLTYLSNALIVANTKKIVSDLPSQLTYNNEL